MLSSAAAESLCFKLEDVRNNEWMTLSINKAGNSYGVFSYPSLFYTQVRMTTVLGQRKTQRPVVKELNCQYQFHGRVWREDWGLFSVMRQRWEVTAGLTQGEVGYWGGDLFHGSIQGCLPLLLSRLGYATSLLHFLQLVIFSSSGWDGLKGTEGNFFGIEKSGEYLRVYYSVVFTVIYGFMLWWDNFFFSLGVNQNFGNKLRVRAVVMRYIIFYAGLEPNPWLIPWER